MLKKVLIITYYWPPSGGVGVHRCLKFAKYLRHYGWEPIIYTAKNANYPYFDETNFKDIPEGITILKHKIIEPFSAFKLLSGRKKDDSSNPVYVRDKKQSIIDKLAIWIRGNFFIPDARSLWINPSIKFLSKYINENHIDAILSDGPPHTNTAIACKLSKKYNIPWLADFQDPWTQVDYYKLLKLTKYADKKHKKMEQEAFKTASKITIASPTWKNDIEKIGAKNVDVIYWGFDEDDFKNRKIEQSNKFIISHSGQLGFDRMPDIFLKVLHDLKNEIKDFNNNLQINLAGNVDYSVIDCIKSNNLIENTTLFGNINRQKALDLTINSNVLLLPLNKAENAMGRIPGKLFECIASRKQILCLGPNNSDVYKIIEPLNCGKSFEYNDYIGIKNYISKQYAEYLSKTNCTINSNIELYSVNNQTKKIAEYLFEITK